MNKPLTPSVGEKRYTSFWEDVINDGDNSIFMASVRAKAVRRTFSRPKDSNKNTDQKTMSVGEN